MDALNKQIRERYLVAFVLGTLPGLYFLGMESYAATSGPWYLPHWDPQYISRISPEVLDELHKAMMLRFCAYFLNSGCQFVFMPAIGACGLVKLSKIAEKRPLLRCFTNSIRFFLQLFAAVLVVGLLVAIFSAEAYCNILESLFLHNSSGPLFVSGFAIFAASIVYFFISVTRYVLNRRSALSD